MQSQSQTPLIQEIQQNAALPVKTEQVPTKTTSAENFLNTLRGFKFQKLTVKDFYFYENKEMWIASGIYCLIMDRVYTQKYLMVNSKSLRFSCTLMNLLIPYFVIFHSRYIYNNYYLNNN